MCKAVPIHEASSWAECGHRWIRVFKDNGANWRQKQSAQDFLDLNWGSRATTKTSHPWRHLSVFASHLSHFTVRLAGFSSTYWYIQSLWSTNYFSLLLTQSYPASCSSDIKFKSSFALCCEFKCLSKFSPMDFFFSHTEYICHSFPVRLTTKSK